MLAVNRIPLCLALVAGFTSAQGPVPLTNDHPIVIEHLIHYYDNIAKHVANRNAEDPANAASRQQGALRIFGLSAQGYNAFGAVLRSVKARLDDVRNAQSQFVSGLTPSSPDGSGRLQEFYKQQQAILLTVPADLKKQLSAADWAALQTFLTNEMTSKIKVAPLTVPRR